MKVKLFLILILSTFTFISCSKPTARSQKFISHGDPYELIKNTELNKGISKIPQHIDFNSMYVVSENQFESESLLLSEEEFLKWQERTKTILQPKYSRHSQQVKFVFYVNEVHHEITIEVENRIARIIALKIRDRNLNLDYSKSHLSFHSSKNMMSALVYWRENKKAYLKSIYFGEQFTDIVKKVTSPFHFLKPEGMPSKWETTSLNIKTCFELHDDFFKTIKNSERKWNQVLRNSKFKFKVSDPSQCLPFSDLNSSGIYYIKYFKPSRMVTNFIPGFVIPFVTSEIVDADMFIFDKELNELTNSYELADTFEDAFNLLFIDENSNLSIHTFLISYLENLFTHELGHILGLGHNSKNSNSIMRPSGLKDSVEELSEEDIEALRYLYK